MLVAWMDYERQQNRNVESKEKLAVMSDAVAKNQRANDIAQVIEEKLTDSPIMCLQEVDQDVVNRLTEKGIGIVWDGKDAAIAFDTKKITESKKMGESQDNKYIICDFTVDGKVLRVASQHFNGCNPFDSDADRNRKRHKISPKRRSGLNE